MQQRIDIKQAVRQTMLIQAFVEQPAIEALDIGVLDRFARLDKVQLDAAPVRPGIQGAARELRAVVDCRPEFSPA